MDTADSEMDSISVPTDWVTRPTVISKLHDHGDGALWDVLLTAGDGACALHAVWGTPREVSQGMELHREGIREYVLRKVCTTKGTAHVGSTGTQSECHLFSTLLRCGP